ncbi:MAG: acyl carrier protein [Lachnospiraceae bacterium]|nr:acyl carrier protein [Lachnospiraceae bacterium]
MTREAAYERLTKVFRKIFDDEDLVIMDTTTANDIEDWDSFEHINLICAIEDEFSFKMPMETVVNLKNVGEMVDVVLELGK